MFGISSKFDFQVAGLKVKVTVAIFRKMLVPIVINGFYYYLTQMFGMTISQA